MFLPLAAVAQPGPFGGFTMSFRVFTSSGKQVTCHDTSYKVYHTYTSNTVIPAIVDTTFKCIDNYFQFTFNSTPTGANIPRNFTINVVHGNKVMRIIESEHIDSIPFHPGTFKLNSNILPFLAIKKKNNARVSNLRWELVKMPLQQEDE